MEAIDQQDSQADVPGAPADPKATLAEQLEFCRNAVALCFSCGGDREQMFTRRIEAMNMAERLMRVSLKFARRSIRHPKPSPIISLSSIAICPKGYETGRHASHGEPERKGIREPYGTIPPSQIRKSKTIPGVDEPRIRNIG